MRLKRACLSTEHCIEALDEDENEDEAAEEMMPPSEEAAAIVIDIINIMEDLEFQFQASTPTG